MQIPADEVRVAAVERIAERALDRVGEDEVEEETPRSARSPSRRAVPNRSARRPDSRAESW